MRIAPLALVAVGTVGVVLTAAAHAEEATFVREEVTFETSDGLELHGTYWAPASALTRAPCVVALHMYRSERGAWEPLAKPLTDRGCALLAIDMRGHGESKMQGDDDLSARVVARDAELFNAMHLDAEAAIEWARKEKRTPKGRVVLVGASVGCSVAIHAATKKPLDVAAVAVLTPGENYLGVPTLEHVKRWYETLPLHIFSSEEERGRGAGPIHGALAERGSELSIVPGTKIHGTRMFGKVEGIEDRIAEWLSARATGPIADGVIEEGEIEGAVEALFDKRKIWVRYSNRRLHVMTRLETTDAVGSDQFRLRITTADGEGEALEIPVDAGMGMSRIDMVMQPQPTKSSATCERSYLASALGVGEGATIRIQVAFADGAFGPEEPILLTLE